MCFFSGEDLSTFFNGDRNCRSAQGYFKETYSIPWETLDKRHFMHRLAPRCGWALKFKLTLPSGAGERVQCLSHKDTVTGYTFAAAVQPVIWLSQKTLCFLPKCVCVWHWDFSQFDHEASPKGSQKTSEGGPMSLEVSGLSAFLCRWCDSLFHQHTGVVCSPAARLRVDVSWGLRPWFSAVRRWIDCFLKRESFSHLVQEWR